MGEATGGHGLPGVGFIPGVVGSVPPFPGAVGAGFVFDEPVFGVEPEAPLVVPGRVPQGEPLGDLPGFVGVFGLMVDGCVVLPGVGLVGEFEPGTVGLVVPFGEVDPGVCGVDCGVAVRAGGVAVLAGGVAGLAGGVAGEPGVVLCPAAPPAGGAPLAGAVCATAQLAHSSTTDSNVNFLADIIRPPEILSVH